MNVVRVFLCLLLAALAACDGDKPAAPQPPREAVQEEEAPPAVVAPSPVTAPRPVAPAPVETPVKTPPAVAAPATPVPPPPVVVAPRPSRPEAPTKADRPIPLAPLDLSLPEELLERLPSEEPLQEAVAPQSLLPPLFATPAPEPQTFELGGRLITNEHPAPAEEDSWHSVEGAELELRFRR